MPERFNCLYGKVCVYTSETHTSAIGFALFGHCHYLLTDPRTMNIIRIRMKKFNLEILYTPQASDQQCDEY